MKLKTFSTLKRLMQQTTSDNDAEALTALRMANTILRTEGIDWDRVFARTVQVINEFEPAPADADPDEERKVTSARIDAAFQSIEQTGRCNDFITSLLDQWTKRRFLSERQMEALFKNAREAEDR